MHKIYNKTVQWLQLNPRVSPLRSNTLVLCISVATLHFYLDRNQSFSLVAF